jgi:hypothetical protein
MKSFFSLLTMALFLPGTLLAESLICSSADQALSYFSNNENGTVIEELYIGGEAKIRKNVPQQTDLNQATHQLSGEVISVAESAAGNTPSRSLFAQKMTVKSSPANETLFDDFVLCDSQK